MHPTHHPSICIVANTIASAIATVAAATLASSLNSSTGEEAVEGEAGNGDKCRDNAGTNTGDSLVE